MADLSAFNSGYSPQVQGPSALRRVGDVGASALATVPAAIGAGAGLAGLIPGINVFADPIARGANQFSEDVRQALTSDARIAEQDANRQRIYDAGAGRTGFDAIGAQAREALGVAVDDPLSAVEAAAGSIPYMIGGGYLAKGVQGLNALIRPGAAALSRPVAAGIGEGGITAGAVASDIVSRGGPDQQFTDRYMAVPAGVVTGLVPGALNRVPGLRGARDIDEAITGRIAGLPGREAGQQVAESAWRRIPAGIGREALEEGLQSPQEQAFTNIGLGQPWYEDVGSAAVEGALAGGIFGGGMNLRGNRPAPSPVDQTTPLDLTAPSEVERTRDLISAEQSDLPNIPGRKQEKDQKRIKALTDELYSLNHMWRSNMVDFENMTAVVNRMDQIAAELEGIRAPATNTLASAAGPVTFNRKAEAAAAQAATLRPRFNTLNDELAYLDQMLAANLVDRAVLPQVLSRRDQIIAERSAVIAAIDAAEKAKTLAPEDTTASGQGGFDFDAPTAPAAPPVNQIDPVSIADAVNPREVQQRFPDLSQFGIGPVETGMAERTGMATPVMLDAQGRPIQEAPVGPDPLDLIRLKAQYGVPLTFQERLALDTATMEETGARWQAQQPLVVEQSRSRPVERGVSMDAPIRGAGDITGLRREQGELLDTPDRGEVQHNNQYAADLFRLFSVGMQSGAQGQVDQARQMAVNLGRAALDAGSNEFARFKAALNSGNLQGAYALINAKKDSAFGGERTAEEGYKRANAPTPQETHRALTDAMERVWSSKSREEFTNSLEALDELARREKRWLDETRDGRKRLIGERKARYENVQHLVRMATDFHKAALALPKNVDMHEYDVLSNLRNQMAGWSYNKAPKADIEAERKSSQAKVGGLFNNIQSAISKLRDAKARLEKEAAAAQEIADRVRELSRLMNQRDKLATSKQLSDFLSRRFRRKVDAPKVITETIEPKKGLFNKEYVDALDERLGRAEDEYLRWANSTFREGQYPDAVQKVIDEFRTVTAEIRDRYPVVKKSETAEGSLEYSAFLKRLADLPAEWPANLPAPKEARAQYKAKMEEVRATSDRIAELETAMQVASEQAQTPVEQLEMFGDTAEAPTQAAGKRARAANRVKRFAYKWFRTGYLSKEDYERVVAETDKEGARVGQALLREIVSTDDESKIAGALRTAEALGIGESLALSPKGAKLQRSRWNAKKAREDIEAAADEVRREEGEAEDATEATTEKEVDELIEDLRKHVEAHGAILSSEFDQRQDVDKVFEQIVKNIEIALARLFDVVYYVDQLEDGVLKAPTATAKAVEKAKQFVEAIPSSTMPMVVQAAMTRGKNMAKGASLFVDRYNDAALGAFLARMEDINSSPDALWQLRIKSPYDVLDRIRKERGISFRDRTDLYKEIVSAWDAVTQDKSAGGEKRGRVLDPDALQRFSEKYGESMRDIMVFGVNTNTARAIRSTANKDPDRLTQTEATAAASDSQRATTNRLKEANRLAAELIAAALDEPVLATVRDRLVKQARENINKLLDKLLPIYHANTGLPASKAGFITAIADTFTPPFKLPGATPPQQRLMDRLDYLLRTSDTAGVKERFGAIIQNARRTRGKDKDGPTTRQVEDELALVYDVDANPDVEVTRAKLAKSKEQAAKSAGNLENKVRAVLSDGITVTGSLKSLTNTDGSTTWTIDGTKDGKPVRRSVIAKGSVIESGVSETELSTGREIPRPAREPLSTTPVPQLDSRIETINERAKAAEVKREDVLDDKARASLDKMGVDPAAVVTAAAEVSAKVAEPFSVNTRPKTVLERASALADAVDRLAGSAPKKLTKSDRLKLSKIVKDASDKAATYALAGKPEKGARAAHKLMRGVTTGKEALERIIASREAPALYRLLARKLLATDAATASFRAVENQFRDRGEYNADDHAITIYTSGGLHTMMHELVHAAVVRKMDGKTGPLVDLYNEVANAANQQGLSFYGVRNVDEMIAEAFTNPEFQKFLASISAQGAPVATKSVWSMFVAAVKRFLGLNTVPNSALERVISLTGEVLAAPTRVRETGTFAMQASAAIEESRQALSTTIRDWRKKGYLSLAFFHDLVEMAKDILPAVVDLDTALNESKTTKRRIELEVEAIASRFSKLTAARQDVVNKFIADSTTEQKWGYQPTWKKDVRTTPQMALRWKSLSAEERAVIDSVFAHGEKIKDRQIKMMKEGNRTDVADYMSKLSGPYAPLKRHGNYLVVAKSAEYVKAKDFDDNNAITALQSNEDHYLMEAYDSLAAAEKRANELKATGKYSVAEHFEKDVEFRDANHIPAHIIQSLKAMVPSSTAGDAAVSEAVTKMLQDMYLNSLSEYSARNSSRIRRNISGFDKNMMRSFLTQGRADAAFSATIEHGQKIKDLMNELRNQKSSGDRGSREDRARMYNMIVRHYVDSLKFNNTPWSDKVMATTSFMQLLSNPSYYLTNLTQPMMVSLPMLAGRHGYYKAWKALTDGYRQIGKVLRGGTFNPQLVFDDLAKEDPELVKALERSQMLGVLDIGIDSEMGQFEHADSPAMKALAAATWKLRQVARTVEIINRISTGVAAYKLEKERLIAGGTNAEAAQRLATEEAVSVLRRTQGDYSSEAAPLLIKYAPKFMTQYRKYQIMQLMLVTRLARQAFKGASAEEKAIARRQLGYIFAHAGAFAGAIGLPMFNVLAFLFAGRDDDDDDLEVSLREALPEPVRLLFTRGIPAYMGMDVAQRIGWGNAFSVLPFADLDVSRKGVTELVFGLSGPVGGLAAGMAEGVKKMSEGDTMQGMAMMMPKLVGNAMKAWHTQSEGLRLTNGDMILSPEEISAAAAFATAIGLPTTTISETQWLRQKRADIEQGIQDRERSIRKQYNNAVKSGDVRGIEDAKQEFSEVQDRKRELRQSAVTPFRKNELRPQTVSSLLKARAAQKKRERELGEIYGR